MPKPLPGVALPQPEVLPHAQEITARLHAAEAAHQAGRIPLHQEVRAHPLLAQADSREAADHRVAHPAAHVVAVADTVVVAVAKSSLC